MVVERISPIASVLRSLYVKSGNRCSFPGCDEEIVDNEGTLIAELCHIEAALTGGERFNESMTNQERAQEANLLYLCHKHHKKTNDVEKFSVTKMKEIKNNHEQLFSNFLSESAKSVEDITKKQILKKSNNMFNINKVLKWDLNKVDLKATVDIWNKEFEVLKEINKDTRTVFSSILERSKYTYGRSEVLYSLIQQSLELSDVKMKKYIDILLEYNLISEPDYNEDNNLIIGIKELGYGSKWKDIKVYCELTKIKIEEIIRDLNFEKLD